MLLISEKNTTKRVSIWCESLFGFYSIKPLIRRFQDNGTPYTIFTPKKYHSILCQYLGAHPASLVCLVERHPILSRVLARLETLVITLFVSRDFSSMYKRIRGGEGWLFRLLAGWIPKWKDPNRSYPRLFRWIVPNELGEGPVLVVTRVASPYWLSSAPGPLHVIMESWDHPVKAPFLHGADQCYSWNQDLLRDIVAHQSIGARDRIYPLKFRYLCEIECEGGSVDEAMRRISNAGYLRHLESLPRQPFLTYVATTQSSNGGGYAGEMILIRQLCEFTKRAGLFLYVKPKPNGNEGEYDSLRDFPNVIIGPYGDSESQQMLDSDYHLYRYCLLKRSRLVINAGTTFVLEAALAETPIVQLEIGAGFPNRHFRDMCNNPHIRKYLNTGNHYVYDGTLECIEAVLDDAMAGSSKAIRFSRDLGEWLSGGNNPDDSFDDLMGRLTGNRVLAKVAQDG